MERLRPASALTIMDTRAGRALRRPENWIELAKFCVVGTSGYVVNLVVFTALLQAGLHYAAAALCSFVVAASNNYAWNRLWTFRHRRGHFYYQGLRFFIVSALALGANEGILHGFVSAGLDEIPAQAIAVVLVTPINFLGNRLWSFRRN